MRRQFVQARRLEASLLRTREHGLVDVRGDDRQGDVRAKARDFDIPQDFQSVRLFARRAAG